MGCRSPRTPSSVFRFAPLCLLLSLGFPSKSSAEDPAFTGSRPLHRVLDAEIRLDLDPEALLGSGAKARVRGLMHHYRGQRLLDAGRDLEALEAFENVLAEDRTSASLIQQTAWTYGNLGQFDQGLRILNSVRGEDGSDRPGTLLLLSEYYGTFHEGDAARKKRSVLLADEAY
ncbi:MAG: hypothetical protein AAF514_00375, partial [Verrucomicrobiota bacterium]